MCLLRCVSFGWMCLHILWCMSAYRQNHFTVSPSSKICCFDFMAWSTAIPSLDMFSLLLLFHTAFSLRLFLHSVDLNGMCAFHFSSPISYYFFSTLHLQWAEQLSCHGNRYSCQFTFEIHIGIVWCYAANRSFSICCETITKEGKKVMWIIVANFHVMSKSFVVFYIYIIPLLSIQNP